MVFSSSQMILIFLGPKVFICLWRKVRKINSEKAENSDSNHPSEMILLGHKVEFGARVRVRISDKLIDNDRIIKGPKSLDCKRFEARATHRPQSATVRSTLRSSKIQYYFAHLGRSRRNQNLIFILRIVIPLPLWREKTMRSRFDSNFC